MTEEKKEDRSNQNGSDHSHQATEEALHWFFSLQASSDDHVVWEEFENWKKADPAHANAFEVVAEAWKLPEMEIIAQDIALAAGYRKQNPIISIAPARLKKANRNRFFQASIAAAAVILIAIGVQKYPEMMLQWQADYLTAVGTREEVTLPDGSRMTLNTGSAVALDFEEGKRGVRLLQGEAYFDVVPDASRPFKVASAFSDVEVKGTAFSVRKQSDHDTIVLEHGHVSVTHRGTVSDTANLEAGETITASVTQLSSVEKVDLTTALAWQLGRFVFDDQPFGDVIDEIARYYAHTIIIANSDLRSLKINGTYRIDDPVRVIQSLAEAAGADITQIPGGIIILH